MRLKLATWNLAKPVSSKRRENIRSHIEREQADIWVLTETHDGFSPGLNYCHSSSEGRDLVNGVPGHKQEHRWVTIWSRFECEPLKVTDSIRTAAVRISPDAGEPFIVFGTVLPWAGSAWNGYPSAGGLAFQKALSVQRDDWFQLQRQFPADDFFVLGDFNQDLVCRPPRYCGTQTNRRALEAALEAAQLVALTGGEGDPVRRSSESFACIDHICASRGARWTVQSTSRWPDGPLPRTGLSDHFGVAAELLCTLI